MIVHFFHHQLLKLYNLGTRLAEAELRGAQLGALRWAIYLSPDALIMPTSDLLTTATDQKALAVLAELAKIEVLRLVGSVHQVDQLNTYKKAHFENTAYSNQIGSVEGGALSNFEAAMTIRSRSTTGDIEWRWRGQLEQLNKQDTHPTRRPIRPILLLRSACEITTEHSGPNEQSAFEDSLATVPERLDGHAFLWDIVQGLGLTTKPTGSHASHIFEQVLAWDWLASYVDEYQSSFYTDITGLGNVSCGLDETHPKFGISLREMQVAAATTGIDALINQLTLSDLLQARIDPDCAAVRLNYLQNVARALTGAQKHSKSSILASVDDTRSAIAGATSPLEALRRAGTAVARYNYGSRGKTVGGGRDGRGTAMRRMAIAVAMVEEFRYLQDAIRKSGGNLVARRDPASAVAYFTVHDLPIATPAEIAIFFAGKGQENAAVNTSYFLAAIDAHIVVSLGISGAMSNDVRLGDVVVGDPVISYIANAKAVSKGRQDYEFRISGDPLRSDPLLADILELAEFRGLNFLNFKNSLDGWGSDLGLHRERSSSIHRGAIACGPFVAASKAFKTFVLRTKRDYLAIDMESSGVGLSTHLRSQIERRRFIAIRGISDNADSAKARLERNTEGKERRFAVVAAWEATLILLQDQDLASTLTTYQAGDD